MPGEGPWGSHEGPRGMGPHGGPRGAQGRHGVSWGGPMGGPGAWASRTHGPQGSMGLKDLGLKDGAPFLQVKTKTLKVVCL